MNTPCPRCGYEMEAPNLPSCVDCHVSEIEREGDEITARWYDEHERDI